MRIQNSMKNIAISIITQVVIVLLGFISRKVFIDNLGTDYLGVNGLLTNLLSMLSLVEGGIGLSIVYNLYKPLAENDQPKIIALIQLYKKIYGILAIVITVLSIVLYLFLGNLIKGGTNVPFIGIVYSIFVFKNIVSYLNAHKWSLINADQKDYVIAKYNLLFNVVTTITKIIVLVLTQNYILFLLIEVVIFIIQNLYNGKIVNDRYAYIKTKERYCVDEATKTNLVSNVKALFLHNIGTWVVFGTDNILISAFVGIKQVGLYSNYTMIIGQLASLLSPVLGGIGASVGNLIATESKTKSYEVFKTTYLINFWIYAFATIFLYNLVEPFINWWLGEGLLLDQLTFFVVLVNFYLKGMRITVNIFKSKAGIFVADKYVPLIEAGINLGASLFLVQYFGLAGIFMGTTISTLAIPVWTQSKLVYNQIFEKSVLDYLRTYSLYLLLVISIGMITTWLCNLVTIELLFISLILKGLICVVVINSIFIVLFYRTAEFQYLLNLVTSSISKSKLNFKRG
ncbi:MAG: lipopolysaccharide biosynthesis protein [Culicoidibacterales bacterium]